MVTPASAGNKFAATPASAHTPHSAQGTPLIARSRSLGDATPASPAVCPLSGTCPPSAGAAGVAASAPRIFAYDCMDGVHAQLLAQPHVAEFFDANLPRNQFISEVALHRSLLASPYRTLKPERADFFYIPFYS